MEDGHCSEGVCIIVQTEMDFKTAKGMGNLRSSEMSKCNVVRAGPSGTAGWVEAGAEMGIVGRWLWRLRGGADLGAGFMS